MLNIFKKKKQPKKYDSYEENKWLEKYEIKHPDYDPVKRDYIGMSDVSYKPLRYKKVGNVWKQRDKGVSGPNKALLMFAGDITCFERQMEEARVGEEDYNFDYVFEKVAPIFAQADLVVGNLETMLSPSAPYRFEQYVCEQDFACNGPVEFLDAIRKAGFDVLTNANNHNLDVGAVGIGETIDNIERFGFIHTGTFKTDKKRYEMIEVNGMKVAIIAFESDQNGKRCNLKDEGNEFLLNEYSQEKAAALLEDAKSAGADFVIVCPHWGKENSSVPRKEQLDKARELAELGFDCIIGSHAHVVQPYEIRTSNGKKVPLFFCLGNFISHNVDNKKSRTLVACIDISMENGEKSLSCSYIPMYTTEHCGKKKYVVVPISKNTKSRRNKRRLERTMSELGPDIEINQTVNYKDFVEKRMKKIPLPKDPKPDLEKITEFPFVYDAGKFVYEVHEDHAEIMKITDGRPQVSYTTSVEMLGLPVTRVQAGAFNHHPVMRKIKFMDNITVIEEGLCKGCEFLEGFRIGNKTDIIEKEAFADCPKLMCAVLKNSLKSVESRAFANCPNLRSVKVPLGVKHIADDAFEGCDKAIFFCEEGSYGQEWAEKHGFKVEFMDLYEGGSSGTAL